MGYLIQGGGGVECFCEKNLFLCVLLKCAFFKQIVKLCKMGRKGSFYKSFFIHIHMKTSNIHVK